MYTMSGVTSLPLSFSPSSPALRFMQQYPREQAEVVAHCALLYGVRCLSVQASTSGALTVEQLRRLSGYAGSPPLAADGTGVDSVEDAQPRAAEVEASATEIERTTEPDGLPFSPPRVSRATRVAASSAIRGAARAWEAEADAVGRGLRQRRVQPPPRPRAARESESDTDRGSNAALEHQLRALETELADLKASARVGSTFSSAAVDTPVQLSDDDAWQAEPPSDRDSTTAVRLSNLPSA